MEIILTSHKMRFYPNLATIVLLENEMLGVAENAKKNKCAIC